MQGLDIDTNGVIASLAQFIERRKAQTKILCASFKNVRQVTHALEAGAQAVTLEPKLLRQALSTPTILDAVDAFRDDWRKVYGTDHLPDE